MPLVVPGTFKHLPSSTNRAAVELLKAGVTGSAPIRVTVKKNKKTPPPCTFERSEISRKPVFLSLAEDKTKALAWMLVDF